MLPLLLRLERLPRLRLKACAAKGAKAAAVLLMLLLLPRPQHFTCAALATLYADAIPLREVLLLLQVPVLVEAGRRNA